MIAMWIVHHDVFEVRYVGIVITLPMPDAPRSLKWPSCVQGKYVVLFFYPLDFTFVCPTEITAFSDRHGDFKSKNTEVQSAAIL